MQTLLEILNKTTEYFKKCEVPDPRLDAQYILAKGLGLTRMELYLKFDRPITDDELARMRPMVQRRGKREPLQHILGSTSFRGLEIKCDSRALIPRPETEVLVEKILEHLSSKTNPRILDIGTGTGAIAIAIAQSKPDAQIVASDLSEQALALAKENVQAHGLSDRIELVHSNLFSVISTATPFDVIVSNPPYIPSRAMLTLQAEVQQYDPKLALEGGEEGLDVIHLLLQQASPYLCNEGHIFLEVGENQWKTIQARVDQYPDLLWKQVFPDFSEVLRFPVLQKSILPSHS